MPMQPARYLTAYCARCRRIGRAHPAGAPLVVGDQDSSQVLRLAVRLACCGETEQIITTSRRYSDDLRARLAEEE